MKRAAAFIAGMLAALAVAAQGYPARPARIMMTARDFRSRMESGGWRILSMPPQQTETFVRAEVRKWPAFLRQAGVSAEP